MAAYLIAEVRVTDQNKFEEYKRMAPPTLAAFGGRYMVRGAPLETLEGDWPPKRVVIIEFESAERAKAWWNSAEYNEAKKLRQQCAESTIILVEGV